MEYKEDASGNEEDAFKIAFKYYKQKASTPSLDNVIDFSDPGKLQGKVTEVTQSLVVGGANGTGPQNMLHRSKWSAYAINSVPGLYFVTDAFSADHQKYWCQKCMQQYCKSPYRTNLDIFHPKNEVDAMWDETKQILRGCDEPMELQSWKKTPIWKLRWSTLGYHYGWSNKLYARKNKSAFPGGLSQMCNYISTSLGFLDFTPEAAIVNYYHAGSALSPHVDVSEVDLQFPLLSVSFGLPAIFLIGGDTRETEPTAILIRSGYILVMSGKSRTAYHALPRVLTAEKQEGLSVQDPVSLYMQHSRLNINVRQVESEQFPLTT